MISHEAKLGETIKLGEYVVIEDGVIIGNGCEIGHHVIIRQGTVIGDAVRIDDFASIGKLPMKAANSAVTIETELPPAKIGSGSIIGTGAVLYRGCQVGEKVLIADLATVRENVTIGEKTIIGRGVTVECFCSIGSYCKLETNAYITAYSEIGNRCFIAPCTVTSNDNFAGRSPERFGNFKGITVKDGGRIGAGAVILPGKTIKEDGFVAAGSVVTKDVEPETLVVGNPAKPVRKVPEAQLLKNQ